MQFIQAGYTISMYGSTACKHVQHESAEGFLAKYLA